MTLCSQTIADRWAASVDSLTEKWIGNMRRDFLARSLAMHLSVADQEWAHPISREAARIRAGQIVDEIGWPRKQWLETRVAEWGEAWREAEKIIARTSLEPVEDEGGGM